MTHNYGEPVQKEPPDMTGEQLARLKELFPEALTGGKEDLNKLRVTLGHLMVLDLFGAGRPPEWRNCLLCGDKPAAPRLLGTPPRAFRLPVPVEVGEAGRRAAFVCVGCCWV